jgi:serine/threonine protein kinase
MKQGAATPLADLTGKWLGSFQIIKLLGKGAMGSVYLAKDSLLRREVALKVLAKDEGGVDEERYERFLREARAAARLIHPNVVQIFQVGESDDVRFIAMEYVEGMTTRQAAKQAGGKLSEQMCIEKMREAADALKLADTIGICHRDINRPREHREVRGHALLHEPRAVVRRAHHHVGRHLLPRQHVLPPRDGQDALSAARSPGLLPGPHDGPRA